MECDCNECPDCLYRARLLELHDLIFEYDPYGTAWDAHYGPIENVTLNGEPINRKDCDYD